MSHLPTIETLSGEFGKHHLLFDKISGIIFIGKFLIDPTMIWADRNPDILVILVAKLSWTFTTIPILKAILRQASANIPYVISRKKSWAEISDLLSVLPPKD